jgi:ABC-type dipeptide/oligopeptide/nickel transport system permease subunit
MRTHEAFGPDILQGIQQEKSEAPWRRGLRSLARKRLAVVAIVLITIIYGAGAYTILDIVRIPTGLQDPVATNLTVRRPIRTLDGDVESLGAFSDRQGVSLARISSLNPDVVGEFGTFTPERELPQGQQLVLKADEALEGPSTRHFFGTDRNGRDLFSRALFSARTTIIFSVLSFLLGSVFLGLGLGLLAGYKGGRIDTIVMRVGDVILGIPGLLLLIVISASLREIWTGWWEDGDAFFGWDFFIAQGIDHITLLLFATSFTGWVLTARFVRAQTLALRETDFIIAAESVGAGTPRILLRHLFPAVLPWIIVGMSASLGAAAGAEVGLTFLGLGIQPPTPSFGAMITAGANVRTFDLHPHILLVPALTIAILIYSFNLLGDAVNDVVNPRGR